MDKVERRYGGIPLTTLQEMGYAVHFPSADTDKTQDLIVKFNKFLRNS